MDPERQAGARETNSTRRPPEAPDPCRSQDQARLRAFPWARGWSKLVTLWDPS